MRRLFVLAALLALVVFQALPAQAWVADTDGDLVDDAFDLCPAVPDPFQGDLDGDGVGDLCDPDATTTGTPGDDLLIGMSGADTTLEGLGGDDALYGGAGDDILDGGAGRDFLAGGGGIDQLTGGSDCDVFALDPHSPGGSITDFQPGVDRFAFAPLDDDPSNDPVPEATFGGDTHLTMSFGEGAGFWVFDGLTPSAPIALDTSPCDPPPFVCSPLFGESEEFYGPYGIVIFPFDGQLIVGTQAGDALIGTRCGDIILGEPGITVVMGQGNLIDWIEAVPNSEGGSADIILGLGGMDYLLGDAVEMLGSAVGGNDVIDGGADSDVIGGDAEWMAGAAQGGDDTITGGDGDDILAGDALEIDDEAQGGNDVVHGNGGNDIISGDAYSIENGASGGNDLIYGDDGSDLITGDTSILAGSARGGNDTIFGGDGDDEIGGDAGEGMSDTAVGGNDTIYGDAGDDLIYGDSGSGIGDMAAAGDDIIEGGPGDDILYGDSPNPGPDATGGSDTFLYAVGAAFGDDEIRDPGWMGAVDTIRFTGSTVNADLTLLDSISTVGDAGIDVLAVVFTDSSKTIVAGTITLVGHGMTGIASWQDIDDLPYIEVEDFTDWQ